MDNAPDYKVLKKLSCLKEMDGARKLVTVTSWMETPGKLDIRWWTPSGRPGDGVTLGIDEAVALEAVLRDYIDRYADREKLKAAAMEHRRQTAKERRIASIEEAFARTAKHASFVRPSKMATYLGVTSDTIKNRVAETDNYIYRDGYVHKLA